MRPGEVTDDANACVIQALLPGRRSTPRSGSISATARTRRLSRPASRPTLLGGAGADTLTTGDGADAVAGDDGDDVVDAGDGDDQVNAGDGDDEVNAGHGDDVVEAGLGVDAVNGGDGNDDLRVRDGIPDTVRCGGGEDAVDADTLDDIALDCEKISRLPTPIPEGGGTTGRDRVAPKVRVGGSTVQRAGRGRFRLVATASRAGDDLRVRIRRYRRPVAAAELGPEARRRGRRRRGTDGQAPGPRAA